MIKVVKIKEYYAIRYYDEKLNDNYKLSVQIATMINLGVDQYNEILERNGAFEIESGNYMFKSLDEVKIAKTELESVVCMNDLTGFNVL